MDVNLDIKIWSMRGLYHYQNENMVVVCLDVDELKEEYTRWMMKSNINIMKQAIKTFMELSCRVSAYTGNNLGIHPRYLCGSKELLREFCALCSDCYSWDWRDFNVTFHGVHLKETESSKMLYLCNNTEDIILTDVKYCGYLSCDKNEK